MIESQCKFKFGHQLYLGALVNRTIGRHLVLLLLASDLGFWSLVGNSGQPSGYDFILLANPRGRGTGGGFWFFGRRSGDACGVSHGFGVGGVEICPFCCLFSLSLSFRKSSETCETCDIT